MSREGKKKGRRKKKNAASFRKVTMPSRMEVQQAMHVKRRKSKKYKSSKKKKMMRSKMLAALAGLLNESKWDERQKVGNGVYACVGMS